MNDNTEAFYRMSKLYYELGEEEDSLRLDHICNITRQLGELHLIARSWPRFLLFVKNLVLLFSHV